MRNQKNSGFLPEERAWMDKLFERWVLLMHFESLIKKLINTRGGLIAAQAWAKNVGWRIDYHIISPFITRGC